jgi:hypothetical protein
MNEYLKELLNKKTTHKAQISALKAQMKQDKSWLLQEQEALAKIDEELDELLRKSNG